MNIKELLKSYFYDRKYHDKRVIENKKLKNQLHDLMLYNRNFDIEDDLKYKIEAIHMQLYEIAIEEEKKLLKSLKSKVMIENLIEELPQPYKMLLYLKYICFYDFNAIAHEMELSESYVFTIHKKALDLLQDKYSDDKKQ